MRLKLGALGAIFAAVALSCSLLPGVRADVPLVGPVTNTFSAGSQSYVVACSGGQSTADISTSAGTAPTGITVKVTTSADGVNYFDPGGTSTTIAAFPGSTTIPLGSRRFVKIADTAYASGSVPVTVTCTGANATGAAGGAAPQPSPLYTSPVSCATPACAVVNFPGITVTPTATPSAAPAGQPVVAVLETQCGTSGLFCPATSSGTNTNGASRNALNVNECNTSISVCAAPVASPNGTAQSASQNTRITTPCANNAGTYNCQAITASQEAVTTGACAGGSSVTAVALIAVNTVTQAVALSAGQRIIVCQYIGFISATTTTVTNLYYGTGTNCAVGLNQLAVVPVSGFATTSGGWNVPFQSPLIVPSGNALCVAFGGSATTGTQFTIIYKQTP